MQLRHLSPPRHRAAPTARARLWPGASRLATGFVLFAPLAGIALCLLLTGGVHAAEAEKAEKVDKAEKPEKPEKPTEPAEKPAKHLIHMPKADLASQADITATSASDPKEVGGKLREALGTNVPAHKKLVLTVAGKGSAGSAYSEPPDANSSTTQQFRQARAAALGLYEPIRLPARTAEPRWSYDGENGPQNWSRLKPEYAICGTGRRQSPINIQDGATLQGPAEPIQFKYTPSNASVLDNGTTILVDVDGENTMSLRNATYRLQSIDFHAPSEIQVNHKRFAMSVNLLHKNDEGQLAILSVLLENGAPNELIEKVWTYLPLDTADRVRMPSALLNVNEILPADQRYYQFMGSLTTPPCTEGVLWVVIKQPVTLSPAQLKLFTQLFPANARPLQTLYGRPVRDAQ